MSDKMTMRFVVASKTSRSASWACVGGADNSVYLLCRELRSSSKFSLHGSGDWRNAFTEEFLATESAAGTKRLPKRLIDRWSRPHQFAPGYTLATRILVPAASVTTALEPLPAKTKIVPAPQFPKAMEIDLIMTSPGLAVSGWPGMRSMGTQLIGNFGLPNGEVVWLVNHEIPGIPAGSHSGAPLFFSGVLAERKRPYNLRALIYGDEPDGSRTIMDLAVSDDDAEKLFEKAARDSGVDRTLDRRNLTSDTTFS